MRVGMPTWSLKVIMRKHNRTRPDFRHADLAFQICWKMVIVHSRCFQQVVDHRGLSSRKFSFLYEKSFKSTDSQVAGSLYCTKSSPSPRTLKSQILGFHESRSSPWSLKSEMTIFSRKVVQVRGLSSCRFSFSPTTSLKSADYQVEHLSL